MFRYDPDFYKMVVKVAVETNLCFLAKPTIKWKKAEVIRGRIIRKEQFFLAVTYFTLFLILRPRKVHSLILSCSY